MPNNNNAVGIDRDNMIPKRLQKMNFRFMAFEGVYYLQYKGQKNYMLSLTNHILFTWTKRFMVTRPAIELSKTRLTSSKIAGISYYFPNKENLDKKNRNESWSSAN